jgi:hypothetical protein
MVILITYLVRLFKRRKAAAANSTPPAGENHGS